MLRALAGCAVTAGLVLATTQSARAEPLSQPRTSRYYGLHASLTFGAFALIGVEELATVHHGPGYDLGQFGPDDAVRANFSEAAGNLSDKLLAVALTAPLFLQMSQGFDTSMGNASLIYAEAHGFDLLLANTAKIIVRRPRPYTHSHDVHVREFAERQGADAYASFYSAHASTAFTSAMAGSLLYAARTDDLAARHAVWGFEFLMAGMTAQLRVRAGRHYRTDIWVGALAGLATGWLVPAAHGVELQRVRGSELATAGAAFAVSMLLSEVVDFCSALDTLHLCALPRDVAQPLGEARVLSPSWVLLPAPLAGGAGLSFAGRL